MASRLVDAGALFGLGRAQLQHADFRGAQAVAVGEQKDGIITFGVNSIEEAAGFILREEIDAGGCPATGSGWRHSLTILFID